MYQQTAKHESLTAVAGRRRTPRQAQHTQSVPTLPVVVYEGNQLGSILEEDFPTKLPLKDAALKIKEAVKKVYRPVDWRKLPQPAIECVLDQLRLLHSGRQSTGCTTCYMRDLCSIQMTCKPWFSEARRRLYTSISVVGEDSPDKLKRYKMKHGVRLLLLRRTLRSKTLLAGLVQEVHVPDPIIPLYQPNGNPNPEYDEYLCLLASLVMVCPNLEVFDGFHPFYNHTFDRLTHALSTRTKLKQHTWIIAENADCTTRAEKQLPPGIMDDHQIYQFLQYHDRWTQLETLLLCSPGSLGVLEHDVLISALHSLPRLKHLCISSFDADDFHDATLLALPRIVSLRLEECPGISDSGLMRWASSPISVLVERLSLIHQNLTSLVTVARVLSCLERIRKFTIIQSDVQPALPLDTVIFQPFFASKSLEFLHWDISCPSPSSTEPLVFLQDALHRTQPTPPTPNTHLALSILHHGFPSLLRVRAPRDNNPPGAIQSVCRPAKNMSMLLPHDRTALQFPRHGRNSNNLQVARIRAQRVIDRAVTEGGRSGGEGGMRILVTDHSTDLPEMASSRDENEPDGDCTCTVTNDSSLSRPLTNANCYYSHQTPPEPPISRQTTTTSSYAPSASSSASSYAGSSTSSSTRATTLGAAEDPIIAHGLADERAMKERYIVGQDWDKEVIVSSAQRPSTAPAANHARHVSAPAPALPRRLHPPLPLVIFGNGKDVEGIAHPKIMHSHTLPSLQTAGYGAQGEGEGEEGGGERGRSGRTASPRTKEGQVSHPFSSSPIPLLGSHSGSNSNPSSRSTSQVKAQHHHHHNNARHSSSDRRKDRQSSRKSSSSSSAKTRRSSSSTITASSPLRVHEFSLPTIVGRVSIHISASGQVFTPPGFYLRGGDCCGGIGTNTAAGREGERQREREGNGGVVGWGELLNVRRRQLLEERRGRGRGGSGAGAGGHDGGAADYDDGGTGGAGTCEGEWNKREVKESKRGWTLGMVKKGEEKRWKHRRRGRGRCGGEGVDVGEFF